MHRLHRSPTLRGFTLVELMITVAVLGVLAAVAVPQYKDYVTRGRIPDATSGLSAKAVQAEQFFQDNRTYAGAGNQGCASDTTSSNYFNFSCTSASATGFVLQATGKGAMLGFNYTVNQSGAKSSSVPSGSGWTANANCWVVKKEGTC